MIRTHKRAVRDFDEALFGHISFSLSNAVRSSGVWIDRRHIIGVPTGQPTKCYYQQLTRYSAAFAFASDVCHAGVGRWTEAPRKTIRASWAMC